MCLSERAITLSQDAIVRHDSDDLTAFLGSKHRRVNTEVEASLESLIDQAQWSRVPVQDAHYIRRLESFDNDRLGASRVDAHDLVPQRRFGEQTIEHTQLRRFSVLSMNREVETDFADVFRVRELPDQLPDLEGTGRGRPQRMETEGDSDPLIIAKPNGLQTVSTGQFGNHHDDGLRSFVECLLWVRKEIEMTVSVDEEAHDFGSCRRTFRERAAALIQTRIS